ncbi:MAG: o-succinylbenzoate synthase [Coleofasciculaceae cyanobacterium]
MPYQFDFCSYHRPFKHPLTTSHGKWDIREGIILRLTDKTGQIGWGEIAPIPWFSSETLEQAKDFCQQLPSEITETDIFSIPPQLSACQFAFESAWEEIGENSPHHPIIPSPHHPLTYSYLLPAGKTALHSWQTAWQQGYRTFKWKIGVAQFEKELDIFEQLGQALPQSAQLRLDANGGLSPQVAQQWLRISDATGIVEFIEQPLPPEQFELMLEMSTQYDQAIALDESVATLQQLQACYEQGWRGIFVVKPAIAGSPRSLRKFCKEQAIEMVFSSALETAVGRKAALQLAAQLSHPQRAVGFALEHWFDEESETEQNFVK